MSADVRHPSKRRRDQRLLGLALTVAGVLLGGLWMGRSPTVPGSDAIDPPSAASAAAQVELRRRFDAAVVLLQTHRHAQAVAAFHQVLALAPRMPEAHVNMGYALLGLQRPAQARKAFDAALALKPDQANAYHGLALANESLGDLELALGAMRTYLHLARNDDEAHLRRARSAVWEWETRLAAQRAVPGPLPRTAASP